MEFQFIKMIALITVIMCGLIDAALLENDSTPMSDSIPSDITMLSYCNTTYNSSQLNETLKSLHSKAKELFDQIDDMCEEHDVSYCLYS